MESRDEMLARHARELDELDSRWWEEWFTEDPYEHLKECLKSGVVEITEEWMERELPNIIRKREKIGVTVGRRESNHPNGSEYYISDPFVGYNRLWDEIAIKLAGRTLAPGEKVEI